MKTSDLIFQYVKYKSLEGPLGESLIEKIRTVQKVFGECDAETDGITLSKIAEETWADKAPATRQRILVQLRAIRNFSYRFGLIPQPSPIPLPYVNNTRYVDVSPRQLEMILEVAKIVAPWSYASLVILSHTGARLGEAMRITKEDLRNDGASLVIHKPVDRKTKTIERTVPLTAKAREVFLSGEPIFSYPNGKKFPNHNEASRVLGKVLKTVCQVLGYQELRLHDLRHAYAALLASYGADLADISSALGHSNIQMSMRYRGLVRGRLEGIVRSIK